MPRVKTGVVRKSIYDVMAPIIKNMYIHKSFLLVYSGFIINRAIARRNI